MPTKLLLGTRGSKILTQALDGTIDSMRTLVVVVGGVGGHVLSMWTKLVGPHRHTAAWTTL